MARTEEHIINLQCVGTEPFFGERLITKEEYLDALNWYSYMCDAKEARNYLATYLTLQDRKDEAQKLSKVSDTWIPRTAAWTAKLLSEGATLPVEAVTPGYVEKKLKDCFSHIEIVEETVTLSVVEKTKKKSQNIIADIEELIDTFDMDDELDFYEWLKVKNVATIHCDKIIAYYKPWLLELVDAYQGKNDQVKEAYSMTSKTQLKERIAFFSSLLEETNNYKNNTKKARKPRKSKNPTADKILKHFKYLDEDKELKAVSIKPEKILESSELWTFNTKTKILTVFRAKDGNLSVDRQSIVNFDPTLSQAAKIHKNYTKKTLDEIAKCGKVYLKNIFKNFKKETEIQSRLNDATLLLRNA